MATRWYPLVRSDEFENPDLLDQSIVDLAYDIRRRINRPMVFSLSRGQAIHPNGDAVSAESPHHSEFSLHRANIDHVASYMAKSKIMRVGNLSLALDFHMAVRDVQDLINVFLDISAMGPGGLGVYPHWNNPGFHIDTRPSEHPSYLARWWAYNDENGKQQYANVTVQELLTMSERGFLV